MKHHFYILWFTVITLSKGSTIKPSAELPTASEISNISEPTEYFNKTTVEDDLFHLLEGEDSVIPTEYYNVNQTTPEYNYFDLEDEKIVNETLVKYGPLHDFNILGLPGPELAVDEQRFNYSNIFEPPENGTFKIRLRTITENFSYNNRYEEGTIDKEKSVEIPVLRGQFGEHFEGKNGAYYIRTVGYILDKKGYRQFLLDLTKAEIYYNTYVPFSGGPGAPSGTKDLISSTVLGTLIGGNLG